MSFGIGERGAAEMAAVVGAFDREEEGGFDLAILKRGSALSERVLFFDGGVEQASGSGGPRRGLAEAGVALAATEQEWKPVEEVGHGFGFYGGGRSGVEREKRLNFHRNERRYG
jgi:hypothetical protein